jgi:hypothetical protein
MRAQPLKGLRKELDDIECGVGICPLLHLILNSNYSKRYKIDEALSKCEVLNIHTE